MERMLKVYVYREGEKPVFHQPYMRGIYASEGWFMKLMEANKKFVVRDQKKAHLFYLPFSSKMLRTTFEDSKGKKDFEKYLKSYVALISRKYRFWNRTGGADHFLVACHDWVSFPCTNLYFVPWGKISNILVKTNVQMEFSGLLHHKKEYEELHPGALQCQCS